MNFEDALSAAAGMDFETVLQFFSPNELPKAVLRLSFEDKIEFDDDGGMPWTSMARKYELFYRDVVILRWTDDWSGYYGGGYAGWWVELIDTDGPPEGLKALLKHVGIELPDIIVPRPPTDDDELEED